MGLINWETLIDQLTDDSSGINIDFDDFTAEDLKLISQYIKKVLEFRCELLRGGNPVKSLYHNERKKLIEDVGISQDEVVRLTRIIASRTKSPASAELFRLKCKTLG